MQMPFGRIAAFTLFAAVALAGRAAAQLPNTYFTPGATGRLDAKTLCSSAYVPDDKPIATWQRNQALTRYGILPSRFDGTLEHLVPVSLGGTNDPDNLFPFHAQGEFTLDARARLANRLHNLVCDGTLSLKAAQTLFKKDWTKAYRQYVAQPVNVGGN